MAVPDTNEHIRDYLQHYCDPSNEFDYAVLLNGPWGVGKTFLIKKFLESRANAIPSDGKKLRSLYVSLYGVTSVRQIEDEFQRQMHPILSSKGMKLTWAISKGVLKAAAKIDLDSKDELTLNAQLPDIDLTGYFPSPKDCVLVFDDLERCSMDVSDVLGYINSFVEHHGVKAIILANEEAILGKDEKYKLIKEKLIGQTLEVHSSTSAALPNFLELVKHQKTKSFLNENSVAVLSIHQQSQTGNLRLLKHALWDFERLSKHFEAKHWANRDAVTLLLQVVLALSFEVRSGTLKSDQFDELATNAITRHMAAKGGPDTSVAGKIEEKYDTVRLQDAPLSFELLRALLFEGWVAAEKMRAALDASRFYSDPALEPAWATAWRGWEIEDDKFNAAVSKVEHQFKDTTFQDTEEMLHIFGLRLMFSKIGAISSSRAEVVTQCIDCLDSLAKAGKIQEFDTSDIWRVGSLYCMGRGVTESETPEFQEIYNAFEERVAETKAARLPTRGKELLSQLREDAVGFARKIMLNNVSSSEYYDVPILATIDPVDFVDAVLALAPSAQSTAFSSLKGRYERGILDKELLDEREWLKNVKAELSSRLPTLQPMSRFRLANLVGHNIDPYLARLASSHA